MKVGLWGHYAVCVSVNPPPNQLMNAWTSLSETRYVYHGTWAHLNGVLYKSLPSVCVPVCVSLLSLLGNGSVNTFPRQRIHATIEELLDASFCMRSVSYERRVCGSVCAWGTGNGTPEVSELPSAWGYSWATLSPGVINTERYNAGEGQQQIYCTELKQFRWLRQMTDPTSRQRGRP
jgi:hypothetical protein